MWTSVDRGWDRPLSKGFMEEADLLFIEKILEDPNLSKALREWIFLRGSSAEEALKVLARNKDFCQALTTTPDSLG